MGYALLWIENLAVSLLFVATAIAWLYRARRRPARTRLQRWSRSLMTALAVLLPVVVYAAALAGLWCLPSVTFGVMAMKLNLVARTALFAAVGALLLVSLVGGLWILVAGLRRREDDRTLVAASAWPGGKLAIALIVAAAMQTMTFWNLDLGIRQRLEVLRAEASALALSVALPPVSDDQNAALTYDQVIATLGPVENRRVTWAEDGFQWPDDPDATFDPASPKLRSFLGKHAASLQLLRDAAKKPACSFHWDYARPSPFGILHEVDLLGGVERLLAADARSKAVDGDLGTALEDINAIFGLAKHFSAEPLPVMMVRAIRYDKIAQQTLEDVLATALPTSADLAKIDLGHDAPYKRRLMRSLRMNEAMGMWTFADFATGRYEGDDTFYVEPGLWRAEGPLLPLYRVFFLQQDLAAYKKAIAWQQRAAAQPYCEARKWWDQPDTEYNRIPQGGVEKSLDPIADRLAKAAAKGDARLGITRLALAACRYRAERGRLPERLGEVVPELMPVVPTDPFDGKPLKWKRTDDGGLVIYSIGPDLSDDDGKPYDEDAQTGDITFTLTP